jgi:hypothetical protein
MYNTAAELATDGYDFFQNRQHVYSILATQTTGSISREILTACCPAW